MTVEDLLKILVKCNPKAKVGIADINFGGLYRLVGEEDISVSEKEILISVDAQEYID